MAFEFHAIMLTGRDSRWDFSAASSRRHDKFRNAAPCAPSEYHLLQDRRLHSSWRYRQRVAAQKQQESSFRSQRIGVNQLQHAGASAGSQIDL